MGHDVLEAHVEGGVGVRSEDGALLADYVLRFSVLVANVIQDLYTRIQRQRVYQSVCTVYIYI